HPANPVAVTGAVDVEDFQRRLGVGPERRFLRRRRHLAGVFGDRGVLAAGPLRPVIGALGVLGHDALAGLANGVGFGGLAVAFPLALSLLLGVGLGGIGFVGHAGSPRARGDKPQFYFNSYLPVLLPSGCGPNRPKRLAATLRPNPAHKQTVAPAPGLLPLRLFPAHTDRGYHA